MFRRNIKGVSLIEGFLAAIIFALAVAVIFNTLNNMRKPAVNNERATKAALILSNYLDDLRAKISSDDITAISSAYTNELSVGLNQGPIQLQGGLYNIYYNVTQDGVSGGMKVDANIAWDDAL